MAEADRNLFREAVRRARASRTMLGGQDWTGTIDPLFRLAMFDMLPVLNELTEQDRSFLEIAVEAATSPDALSYRRFRFALNVVVDREIVDHRLSESQVNDGRQFLGCTRLNEVEVLDAIASALAAARQRIALDEVDQNYRLLPVAAQRCCGEVFVAWSLVLVPRRREHPNASLVSSLAAAAHYMLARFHVCAAQARVWQMNAAIEAYDQRKRIAIARGDRTMSAVALTGNPPYPPDFGIREWAFRGTRAGEADRTRCNARASLPTVAPTINNLEWGFLPRLFR